MGENALLLEKCMGTLISDVPQNNSWYMVAASNVEVQWRARGDGFRDLRNHARGHVHCNRWLGGSPYERIPLKTRYSNSTTGLTSTATEVCFVDRASSR
jgi:hypothetical protein